MARVVMYGTHTCPYCRMAETLLGRKRVTVEKIFVDDEPGQRDTMIRRSGRRSVPQIFIGDRHVGGYTELAQLEHAGELDALLAQP